MIFSLTLFPCSMEVIPTFNVVKFNWTYIQVIEKILVLSSIEEHVSGIEKNNC